jgi:hypothetical protein
MSPWEDVIARIKAGKMSEDQIAKLMLKAPFAAYYEQRFSEDGLLTPGEINGLAPKAEGQ